MKKRIAPTDSIIQVEDDDDDEFLSQIAAAEAHALSNYNKRQKISSCKAVDSLNSVNPEKTTEIKIENEVKEVVEEGAYIAALRGSKSVLWQEHQQSLRSRVPKGTTVFGGGGGSGGGGGGGGEGGHYGNDTSIPEKACACGLGTCVVLTANTEKNRGRKFYKCPLRQENGGCGFFEWCDNSSGTNNTTYENQDYASNPSFPDLPCSCGAGTCLILTAKTGKYIGQQFYRCPENQGSSCGFFKWCNGHTAVPGFPVSASKVYNMTDTSNKSFGVRAGSSCFKCGWHWAKDCPIPSSGSPADLGARSASSGTCYKCGKPGHWARDCSSSQYMDMRQKH